MSLIMALHARYEQVWAEYDKIDESRRGRSLFAIDRFAEASLANKSEIDAIDATLLYQIPATDEEALILAQHIWARRDAIADGVKLPRYLTRALDHGLTSLFDFLADQAIARARFGKRFRADAELVADRRRRRAGDVAEAAGAAW